MRRKRTAMILTALMLIGMTLAPVSYHKAQAAPAINRTIGVGDTGSDVKELQSRLMSLGYGIDVADGIYGDVTARAVASFQSSNGLNSDGVCGPLTIDAVMRATTGTAGAAAAPVVSQSGYRADLDVLARCIYSESRGEPYIGQVAVGAVVLNRTRNPSFPRTISGVIFQPGAFDAVYDGQIDLTPDDTAYRAAQEALNGWDPSGGAIFYYNPRTAADQWIRTRPIICIIGNHAFAA